MSNQTVKPSANAFSVIEVREVTEETLLRATGNYRLSADGELERLFTSDHNIVQRWIQVERGNDA